MEMGFSRTRCLEALAHTQTIEEATDYLLTRGSDFAPPVQVGCVLMIISMYLPSPTAQSVALWT